MNLVQIIFCLLVSTTIIYGSMINFFESKLPHFLRRIFRFGKFAAKGEQSILVLEVPKSWFKHFYVGAVFLYSYVLLLVTLVYIYSWDVPSYIKDLIKMICGDGRYAYTPKNKVFIAIVLMTLQVFRRFYDTQLVSVFGENSKMNLSHYVIGQIYYPGSALAILCEAPMFTDISSVTADAPFKMFNLTYSEIFAIFVFLWAWKHQHTCTKILGDLRKNSTGEIVTSGYKLPQGDWFKYLSAPHQTAEILMYTCLMWLLWHNITWFFIFSWVLVNQVECILLSHWWYQEKFKDFPRNRKALIPFLY